MLNSLPYGAWWGHSQPCHGAAQDDRIIQIVAHRVVRKLTIALALNRQSQFWLWLLLYGVRF